MAKRKAGAARAQGRPSGWSADSDQSETVYLLYDDLIRSRDRLAGLGPATPQDLERVEVARHEVIFHLLTVPPHVASDLPVAASERAQLVAAARDRSTDAFVGLVALVAQKLASSRETLSRSGSLSDLKDGLDSLTFDYRVPKKETLALLRALREDLDGRLAYVKRLKPTGYRFLERPEQYRDRPNRREKPDQFFERVYRGHVRLGLTQADIRLADPAYYNVLHVWCSRHGRALSSLVPASWRRG